MNDSDSIRLSCPACAKRLRVKADLAGRRIRCPNPECAEPILVPVPDEAVEAPTGGRPVWPWVAGGIALVVLVPLAGIGVWALAHSGRPAPAPTEPPAVAAQPVADRPAEPSREPGSVPVEPAKPTVLPGAGGERITYVNKPADLRAVYLSATQKLPKGGPEAGWDPHIPAGTTTLHLGVVFRREMPDVKIEVRMRAAAGETTVAEGVPDWLSFDGSTYVRFLTLTAPPDGWPDGPYQAEVRVNEAAVAVLNWSVHKDIPKPAADPKAPPAGTSAEPPAVITVPIDTPGDPALSYEDVRKDPAKYRGKRVVWSAFPTAATGAVMMCAANPEAKDRDWRLFRMYSVKFASESDCTQTFLGHPFVEGMTITGTVAGPDTVSYNVAGPGGTGKERKTETVPLIVDPVVHIKGREVYRPAGEPTTIEPGGPKAPGAVAAPKVDDPLAAAVATGEPVQIQASSNPSMALSPDGNRLAFGGGQYRDGIYRGVFTLIDTRTSRTLGTFPLSHPITCVAFSPDDKLVAVGSGNPKPNVTEDGPDVDLPVYLLDATTGKIAFTLTGHRSKSVVGVNWVGFTADGKLLGSSAQGDAIRIWNTETGKLRRFQPLDGRSTGWALSPDGKRLAGGSLSKAYVWDAQSGAQVTAIEPFGSEHLVFSPDGATLLAASFGEFAIHTWDPASGKERARVTLSDSVAGRPAFSPDGKWMYFMTARRNPTAAVMAWRTGTGNPILLRQLDGYAGGLAVSSDGTTLAASTLPADGKAAVHIWRVGGSPPAATSPPTPVAPTEDELLLLSAGPADNSLAPVLRYVGNDLDKALAAGNRLVDTTRVDAVVRVDPDDPKKGTVPWRGFEWRHGGTKDVTNFGRSGITLGVRRKTPTTTDWELSDEAVRTVKARLAKR